MKTLNKNNKNPQSLSWKECFGLIIDSYNEGEGLEVGVGNDTTASVANEESNYIIVKYRGNRIAVLLDNESVRIYTGGNMTETTKRRLDWVLLPLGYRLTSKSKSRRRWGQNHDAFKVYRISDGIYLDFIEGMTLVKR
jgi:hypothetical protein